VPGLRFSTATQFASVGAGLALGRGEVAGAVVPADDDEADELAVGGWRRGTEPPLHAVISTAGASTTASARRTTTHFPSTSRQPATPF
jgi:hypothetical protein